MLSYEEQAIMRNLPAIVADLESMDIIDHLTATTPPSITPADYESIIVTSQREGRRAGVRCLIACLLRRTESSKIFQSLLSILKEDYSHLSDLLSNTYESLKKEKKNDELDFGAHSLTLLHFSPVVEVDESTTINTPCQLVSKDIENSKIPLKILGSSEYDIIFSIISTISSHPIAVINWRDLLNELLGCATVSVTTCGSSSSSNSGISRINNSESKNNNSSTTDFENFQWCASNCRRGLFHFFSINMIRNLESRGSPFKRSQLVISNTVKFNLQFIKKLIVEQLIPALQHLNLWNLTNRIQEEIEYNDENRYDSLRDISFNKCSLLYANDLPYRLLDSNYHTTNNGTNLSSDHSQSLSSFSF
ncbi:unnamed protein product [Heterobilharzia americana]|nr:unnamed protein product [Heterobilharzia americana]